MTTIDLSLVICTRNRAAQLRDQLPHLRSLRTAASWEIVFVDNGSSDATSSVLAEFARGSSVRTRILHQPVIGLSAARNTGWRAAEGRIIVFTDDDCYPEMDFLEQARACLARDDIGFVGGRVLRYDPNDLPVAMQTLDRRVEVRPRSVIRPGLIIGANMAFQRGVLERMGGFDEKLGAGRLYGADEDDLIARASAAGIAGIYDPAPVVYHHHRRSRPDEALALTTGYDIGRGAFLTKMLLHPQTRWLYLWPVLRRFSGNLLRRDFTMIKREAYGAWKYLRD